MPEQIFVVEPHSEHIGKGCPTCRRGIEEGQTIVVCPRCHSLHHDKCWFDQGGCGKVGCKGVASKREAVMGDPAAKSAAAAAANPVTHPVSTQANQLPTGVVYGIVAVVVLIALYFIFLR